MKQTRIRTCYHRSAEGLQRAAASEGCAFVGLKVQMAGFGASPKREASTNVRTSTMAAPLSWDLPTCKEEEVEDPESPDCDIATITTILVSVRAFNTPILISPDSLLI